MEPFSTGQLASKAMSESNRAEIDYYVEAIEIIEFCMPFNIKMLLIKQFLKRTMFSDTFPAKKTVNKAKAIEKPRQSC